MERLLLGGRDADSVRRGSKSARIIEMIFHGELVDLGWPPKTPRKYKYIGSLIKAIKGKY